METVAAVDAEDAVSGAVDFVFHAADADVSHAISALPICCTHPAHETDARMFADFSQILR